MRSSYVRGRGTETSAEDLVGPPWRMVSNAGQQQWYGGYPCTPDGGHWVTPPGQPFPPPNPPPQSASEGIGGAHFYYIFLTYLLTVYISK